MERGCHSLATLDRKVLNSFTTMLLMFPEALLLTMHHTDKRTGADVFLPEFNVKWHLRGCFVSHCVTSEDTPVARFWVSNCVCYDVHTPVKRVSYASRMDRRSCVCSSGFFCQHSQGVNSATELAFVEEKHTATLPFATQIMWLVIFFDTAVSWTGILRGACKSQKQLSAFSCQAFLCTFEWNNMIYCRLRSPEREGMSANRDGRLY